MPPTAAELQEIEELKAMIKGSPERPSSVPIGTVSRFLMGEDNRKRADAARKEKEERDALKAEVAAIQAANQARIKAAAEERRANEKRVKAAEEKRKTNDALKIKQKEAAWKAKKEKNQKEWEAAAYKRVQVHMRACTAHAAAALSLTHTHTHAPVHWSLTSSLHLSRLRVLAVQEENEAWKRMAKAEAAQDKLEREEGTRDRKAVEAAFRAEQERTLAYKKSQVAKVKAETAQSIVEEALSWAAKKREAAAEARRKQQALLKERKESNKQSFVASAHGIKGQVNSMKENVKVVKGAMLNERKAHAAKERDNDYLVQQSKIRMLASKKQQHQAVYGKRYAPSDVATIWTGASTLRRGAKVKSPQ